ncbi:hypothetical protein F5884DRAFT_519924 [Xylogone sp. PMI_703]|nr:hypothetical protein F5884DRAFT_519924 [Xylogone sp. PMI_703]
MARQRNQKKEKDIRLAHPDRSFDPSRETLLKLAEERGLFKDTNDDQSKSGGTSPEGDDEVLIGRAAEAVLWSISLTALHFTIDFLVHHQYAMSISWSQIATRSAQAFPIIWLIFYTFHPHPAPSIFVSASLAKRTPPIVTQLFFAVVSVASGCYLIYITNMYGYLATMKRAPPVGCMWIWAVIELDLLWASISLLACVGFLKLGGYKIT